MSIVIVDEADLVDSYSGHVPAQCEDDVTTKVWWRQNAGNDWATSRQWFASGYLSIINDTTGHQTPAHPVTFL